MVSVAEKSLSWFLLALIYVNGLGGMLVVSATLPALPGIGEEFHPESPALVDLITQINLFGLPSHGRY